MSNKVMYVPTLEDHYLLDALALHIYKKVVYWKLLLLTKRLMLFYYIIDLLEKNPDVFDSFNNLKKLIIDIYSRKADFVLMIGDINAK